MQFWGYRIRMKIIVFVCTLPGVGRIMAPRLIIAGVQNVQKKQHADMA